MRVMPQAPPRAAKSCAHSPCASVRTTFHASPRHRVRGPQSRPAQQTPSIEEASTSALTSSGVTYTNYECNSFAVKFNSTGVSVLVDPWLVDDLVFGDAPWLFRGKKRMLAQGAVDVAAVAAATDVLLITQDLPDHFHEPTLKLLPKSLPVVTSPQTADMARDLGFTNVTSVDHGQTVAVAGGKLRVKATKGALVGPPWSKRQNGFVMREAGVASPSSVYFEPHCDFDEQSVAPEGPVDVVVSPIGSQLLNLGVLQYPLVQGDIGLVRLLQLLRPKVLVPLPNAEIDQEGPLAGLILDRGGLEATGRALKAQGVDVRVEIVGGGGESKVIRV